MSGKTYDVLKYIAQIVLPALATLYVAVAGIWHLPYAEAVSGTIMAIDYFLGKLLQLSSEKFFQENEIVPIVKEEEVLG